VLHRQMQLLHEPVRIKGIGGQIHLVPEGPSFKAGLP
jgi:hypothetical protein